jgi:hypothetical protein
VTYTVRLEPTSVREALSVNALSLHSAVEEDVGQAHDVVVDDSTAGDQAKRVSHGNPFVRGLECTYSINQPKTSLDALLSCMKDRHGKHMTTKKQ